MRAVYLIGSLARGSHSGTSDVALLLRVSERAANPIEAVRPYFFFFSRQLDIGIDLLLCDDTSLPDIEQMMEGSILLASRDAEEHPEHQACGSGQTNSSEGQAAGQVVDEPAPYTYPVCSRAGADVWLPGSHVTKHVGC